MPNRLFALVLLLGSVARPAGALIVTDLGSSVQLATPELTVTVDKAPFRLSVADAGATTILEEAPGAPNASLAYFRGASEFRVTQVNAYLQSGDRVDFTCGTSEGPTATVAVRFPDDGTFFVELAPPTPATVTEAAETFVAPAGERYYGLTERIVGSEGPLGATSELIPQAVGSLDRRGELVKMSVAATISIYAPFFHGSNGYGVFVDGPMQGSFDLAKTVSDRLTMRFNFERSSGSFRYWVFHGPDHARIVDRYTQLTGRPWQPPRWAYKHMRWRDEHHTGVTSLLDGVAVNADLVEDVTMYEALGFPTPGWYNLDRPWSPGASKGGCPELGFARFTLDPARFPNATQMIASLRARGTRTVVFDAPWACGDQSDPLDNAYEAHLFGYYAPNSPDHIDFTNPAATLWWQDKFGAFVTSTGISGFKLDRGDETAPSAITDVYFDGRNGLQLHNDYPRLYVKAYADRLQAVLPDDWVTMARPGYAGSQAYGLYWGGDTTGAELFGLNAGTDKGLRGAILSLQHLAFMGFPNWGTDTGGYYQFKQRDVFGRWLEFSALCPVMEIGGGTKLGDPFGPHAPWAMPTTPTNDFEMAAIYRLYTWLHHELVPYSYSEGIGAHATGHPIATPLVFEWPNDPNLAGLFDEYLYGPSLLVAPIWQNGSRARDVYLPAGAWTNFWNDDDVRTGPVSVAGASTPLGRLPLWVRLGSIIPLDVVSGVTGHGSAGSAGRLTVDLYPHLSSSYDLREETGTVPITSDKLGAYGDAAAITITTGPATHDWLLRVRSGFRPSAVTLDGSPLAEQPSEAALAPVPAGWTHLGAFGRTLVKYTTAAASSTIVLTPGSALVCGNGTRDPGEECDDGNTTAGDGCSLDCRFEVRGSRWKTYAAHGTGPASQTAVLTDEIESKTSDILAPTSLGYAVDKDGEGVRDATAHLACYGIRDAAGQPPFTRRTVRVRNQFGVQTLQLRNAESLCVPSEVDGVHSALDLDHYKCYRARRQPGSPRFRKQRAVLVDDVETNVARVTARVTRPSLFCTPVDRDGAGVRDPDTHLSCFKIGEQPPLRPRPVGIQSAFDAASWTVGKAGTLCVPSRLMP
jgi:alpha-D-xyloside xylohydrolase